MVGGQHAGDGFRFSMVKLGPPEIARHFLEERAGFAQEFGLERHPTFEGVIVEKTLAEAVNGEDLRVVKIDQRQIEFAQAALPIAQPREPLEQRGGFIASGERGAAIPQTCPHPLPQLLGRRNRVGNGNDVADRQVFLEQKQKEKSHEGIRLPGAGAGFDQGHTGAERDRV